MSLFGSFSRQLGFIRLDGRAVTAIQNHEAMIALFTREKRARVHMALHVRETCIVFAKEGIVEKETQQDRYSEENSATMTLW